MFHDSVHGIVNSAQLTLLRAAPWYFLNTPCEYGLQHPSPLTPNPLWSVNLRLAQVHLAEGISFRPSSHVLLVY